ncbi:radical SAM protein [Glycomyces paridis]|uniref:Radical SAM protein n=1 Tax=Glycomyces paridis TaxID=2126555 RepID=A0A4S8PDA5_9ACTN|nr:radical SAM protein [Glycomyces paridis]THV28347.1 radical SAM protein [Glycomyces paridis]
MLADQTFMIANSCNLSCTYCWYEVGSSSYAPTPVDAPVYDRWLERCRDAGIAVERVNFTGGEPLLREDFPELLAAASRHAAGTAVFTNAVLVRDATAELLAASGTEVHVSIDHVSDHIGDRVRGGTKATLKGIARLLDNGVRDLQVCVVVTAKNHADLPEIVRFVRERGLALELMPVGVPETHPLSLRTIGPEATATLSALIEEQRDLLGREGYYRRMRRYLGTGQLSPTPGCAAAEQGVFVNADGEIWLCPQRDAESFGNIATADPAAVLERKAAAAAAKRPGSCVKLDCLVLT